MQVVLGLAVALLLVLGQTLWKYGVQHMHIAEHAALLRKVLQVGLNGYILGGLAIYAVATVLYIYVIGKYSYGSSYALIVSLSLIFATLMASLFFHEKMSTLNIAGLVVVLVGIFLVLKK